MSKLAVVTGGSRGIGRAICVRLAKAGFDILFNYCSGDEAAKETISLCEKEGVNAYSIKADVSVEAECEKIVEKAVEINGSIDVLVNNAGITRDNLIIRMSEKDFDDVIDVNLKGTFLMMKKVSKYMLKKRQGRIVNISSVVGVMGNAGQVNYSASKAGIIGMTKSLAKELAARNININAIAPGMIETDMTAVLNEDSKKAMKDKIPLNRMGKPEDIANVTAFLCSEESSYITGQVICVDGGMAI